MILLYFTKLIISCLNTLSEEVKRDFGFEIDHTTHAKIIFKKS